MFKNILTCCLSLLVMSSLWAQKPESNNALHGNLDAPMKGIYNKYRSLNQAKDITFNFSDIEYFVGQGSNQAMVIIAWDDDPVNGPTALVWGVRFNGAPVAMDLLDSIVTHDSRFTYQAIPNFMQQMRYTDNNVALTSELDYWCIMENGVWGSGYGVDVISNGDVIEISATCDFPMTSATAVSDPNTITDTTTTDTITVADATIAASEIAYWIGSGSQQAVLAVNWAMPDTALAWGFRFEGDNVSLKSMMDSIDSRDPRFHYEAGAYGPSNILFATGSTDTLRLSQPNGGGNYWWMNYNGTAATVGYDALMLHDGDVVKWGDPTCGIVLDTAWGYPSEIAWTTTIHPVSIPSYEDTTTTDTTVTVGPFCGAVGTEGCEAISCDSEQFVAWATGCTVVRGSQNLTNEASPEVTYGTEEDAIGPATTSTMDVVSLGDGGSATLTFDLPIVNGEGYDFAVFENSFNDEFLELAFVEVSSDGEHFVRFPATSLTQTTTQVEAIGTLDPTFINNLAGKYRAGWGTPFDLEELRDSANLNINSITHVRVVDVVGSINPEYGNTDALGNMVNDPFPTPSYSAGFDLDGVGVIHQLQQGIAQREEQQLSVYPNPARNMVQIDNLEIGSSVELYDMTGRLVQQQRVNAQQVSLNVSSLANGVYVLRAKESMHKLIIRH